MKKNILFLIGGAALLSAVSCSIDEDMIAPEQSDTRVPMVFTAGEITKTSLVPHENNAVIWSADDAINVFDGTFNNHFSISSEPGTATASFAGEAVPDKEYYALYPYSAEASMSGKVISSELPTEQHYAYDSFDTMLNPSVAKAEGTKLAFHNVASLLRINVLTTGLSDAKAVKEIQVTADKSLTGHYTVDMSGEEFVAVAAGTESLGARLVAADGGSMADTDQDGDGLLRYHIVVFRGEYADLTVTVTYSDGTYSSSEYHNVTLANGASLTVDPSEAASKPKITYEQEIPVCGVSGGTLPFRFKIESNGKHPLKTVQITCAALGIDETVQPEQTTSSWEMDHSVNLAEGIPAQQNVSFTIKAVNDIDGTAEYNGTLNVIENVYLIGRGTLALEKEGQAILMEQDAENPDVFSAVTWINKSGLGVKFLSERSWNAFNWGLGQDGNNIVSPESSFIPVNGTGYYRCSFNPTTWEYSFDPVTVSDEPVTEELYLNGNAFSYWDEAGQTWTPVPSWSGVVPFRQHPDNPHCFYIDVKTGPANSDVALWKIFGQTALEGEGLFYGVNAEPDTAPGGSQYVWQWWEYCGPAYRYSTFDDISYFKEGSRTDAVMRLTVDTWLGYMSWMPLKEQQDAGWEIYPELYTPIQ